MVEHLKETRIVGENNRYTNAYYINSQTNADKIENNTFLFKRTLSY